LNQIFYRTHAVPAVSPLSVGSPSWFRVLGYCELGSFITAITLAGNAAYNSVLEATPDDPEGDPVHMRSPILWIVLLQCLMGVALLLVSFSFGIVSH
jgi:hypothetical protein